MARRRKPQEVFTGITLEQWQRNPENILWAQREPRFKEILSVILNESPVAYQTASGCSEGRAFGRVEGYLMALEVMRKLAKREDKEVRELEPTFDEKPEHAEDNT